MRLSSLPLPGLRRSLAGAGAAAALIWAPTAAANTINVTTGDDVSGPGCSLRSAITAANTDAAAGGCGAGQGADTIVLHSATYALQQAGRVEDNNATGDLDVNSSITIAGDGMNKSIINANGIDRVIEVFTGSVVVLRDLAITGGSGGGQPASPSTTSSNGSQDVTGNPANLGQDGGGIRSSGDLTLDRVLVAANEAGTAGTGGNAAHTNGRAATGGTGGRGGRGGGIASSGQLLVRDSRIDSNTAGIGGTGGAANGGPGTTAGAAGGNGNGGSGGSGGAGGGIYTRGPLTVERSFIVDNRAGRGGVGGGAAGGNGASNTTPYTGGNGGAANGGIGGHGGFGGGIAIESVAGTSAVSVRDSAVTGNLAGDGGTGKNAVSGYGGDGGGFYMNNGGASILTPGAGGVAVGGRGGYGGSGGGIAELDGEVNVERTTLAGNKAGSGSFGGSATSSFSGTGDYNPTATRNSATAGAGGDGGSGGGIATAGSGTKTLTDSTLDSNATGGGGTGSGTVTGSPATGGSGGGAGGGGALDSHLSAVGIVRSTITANSIGTPGSGASGAAGGTTGGASAIWAGGSTRLTASIVSENQASRCVGTIEDGGNNIEFPGDPACPGTAVDPLLKPLADNGGTGQTRALSPTSPAIDSVACNPATDERGVPRPIGAKCDAGAYEFARPLIAGIGANAGQNSATVAAQVTPYAGSATVTVDWGTDTSYGSSVTQTVSGGVAMASGVTQPLNGLQAGTTYHYRLRATSNAGTTTTTDRTFRTADAPGGGDDGGGDDGSGDGGGDPGGGGPVIPSGTGGDGGFMPPPGTPADVIDPVVRGVKADPSKFLVGTKKTPVRARRGAKAAGDPAVGTKLKFTLSEDADVDIALERKTVGKKGKTKAGKKTCKAARKPPTQASDRCTLFVDAGTLSRDGDAGGNSIAFSGRLGSHALPVGAYRFIVSASDSAGNDSDPVTAKFTILDPDDN